MRFSRTLTTSLTVMASVSLIAAHPAPGPITLPGDRLHPESVSITPDGTAYVGSMYGGVLRIMLGTGKVEPWIAPGAYGSGALFGVLADPRNGLLWTCTNDYPPATLSVAGADPGHWLKGFDLKTGKGRVSLKLPGEKPVCNDMAVGRDGSLYVTDTGQPRILRWRPGAMALEVWAENPVFGPEPSHGGLDGIALGADGALYLNNVRSGALYRVTIRPDGAPGAITSLTPSRPLAKPDGMRPISGLDFLVAEGDGKVSLLSIKGDKVEVTTLAEGINQPTGVDIWHGRAWYVQAQLSAIFRPTEAKAELPFRLTPIPLKP
jgi:sugar lactone lactonase YvrE